MKSEVNINVNMITWAIARAGHDLHEFLTHYPKIQEWIENKKKPTVKQLESFSHKVHLPFGYLLLPNPPKEEVPIPFFRTEEGSTHNVSLNVYDTVLQIQYRQEWLRDYLLENESDELSFVGKFNVNSEVNDIVNDIRQTLNLNEDWARSFSSWEKALNYLTEVIEEKGIVLSFNSIVGNNTTRPINVDECRGFVLVDNICPFMFINSADGKAAQMFTIIHELAHIWTGKSAGFDFRKMQPAHDAIEELCDKVAAEFLVPQLKFDEIWQEQQSIKNIARIFKVSPIVVARRAMDLGKISRSEFFIFYNNYVSDLKFKKEKQTGGGDFYTTAKKRISLTFAYHINHAVQNNSLLYRDAFKLTGLKGNTYHKFLIKHLE